MGSPSDSMLQNQQGKYIRARENPFFDGLTKGNASKNSKKSLFDSIGRSSKQKLSRWSSVISHKGYTPDNRENVSHSSSKGLQLDITKDLWGSESVDIGSSQIKDEIQVEKSLSVNKKKQNLLEVSVPQCAATFYYGCSLPKIDVVESCESIQRLNSYLKDCKDAVNTGVPGKFLRAVLGHVSDAGSFISTIMYSFYLNETEKSSLFCTVPIMNIKREDINSHAELQWLLNSCNVDLPSLMFIDEVDLSYYDLFGSLKIVLLNADKLPQKQEALKESVVEIFTCQKGGLTYPSDDNDINKQECSCCALIAEKFASTSPEILAGRGFSRLVLGCILLDTDNLTSPKCTSVDRYMSTLLLNGAGRFGCNGLYHILRSKLHDVSQLRVGQILQKDFKKWTREGEGDISGSKLVASDVGMSAVGISISQLLSHDETSIQEIVLFQQLEKLRLLIIVSGYGHNKNFKEMLVSAESEDLMKELLSFLDNYASHLSLHALYQPGLSDEMRAFSVNNFASRTIIEQLLHDFSTS